MSGPYRTATEERNACAKCEFRNGDYCDGEGAAVWNPVRGWLQPRCDAVREEHPLACPHYRKRPTCTPGKHLGPVRRSLVLRRLRCTYCGGRV